MTKSYAEQRISLTQQLAAQAPAELLSRFDAHAEALTQLGGAAAANGTRAPDFTLLDATGRKFALATALADGPVVLTFYRGGWCPFCNLQLHLLQAALPQFRSHGGRLVAISPESPDDSLTTAEKHALEFDVLSDPDLATARAYGLEYVVEEGIRDAFRATGTDLGATGWRLPISATYVIGADGLIHFAHVNGDFRVRAEIADILHALSTVSA
ncbi:peroxiredoxin-like family protein [Nocardia sp. NPDC051832]|uniref:peroxiredoxin-like family protein n=1 Tax=Nocardia sp. NPDC051832 TaxID=3155673 RepID=UPI003442CFB3